MGLGTKRRARKLPDLIAQLESGLAQIKRRDEARAEAGQQTDEGREGAEYLSARGREYLERARAYHDEFSGRGSISGGEFDAWFKEASGWANLANMSPEELRTVIRVSERLPGGPK